MLFPLPFLDLPLPFLAFLCPFHCLSLRFAPPFLAVLLPFLDLSLPSLAIPLPFLGLSLLFLALPLPFLEQGWVGGGRAPEDGSFAPSAGSLGAAVDIEVLRLCFPSRIQSFQSHRADATRRCAVASSNPYCTVLGPGEVSPFSSVWAEPFGSCSQLRVDGSALHVFDNFTVTLDITRLHLVLDMLLKVTPPTHPPFFGITASGTPLAASSTVTGT